jgi:UPF0755 protein
MATNTTTVKLTLKITSLVLKLLVNILFYVVVVILTINFSKMAYDFTYQLYGPVSVDQAPGTDIIIEIQKGDSTMDVAKKLELKMAIKNKYAFYLKTKLEKSVIMPGTYAINTSMTYKEILAVITDLSASLNSDGKASDEDTNTDEGATVTPGADAAAVAE